MRILTKSKEQLKASALQELFFKTQKGHGANKKGSLKRTPFTNCRQEFKKQHSSPGAYSLALSFPPLSDICPVAFVELVNSELSCLSKWGSEVS